MAKILAIDDEPIFSGLLASKLREMNHEVTCASSLQEGLLKAEIDSYDVVYLDVHLPDGNGIDQINRIKSSRSQPEVIIMTGGGDADGAELAIVNGAWDYIEKPSSVSSMILPLVRALQCREIMMKKPAATLKLEGIVVGCQRMHSFLDQMAQAAGSDACVLIGGETGTGKELVAWAIHNNSVRAKRNFVVVDCASLSETLVESVLFGHTRGAYTGADTAQEGLIRQADGGTLFLDEIGELPSAIQKSFLRVLQERRFRPLGASQEISSDFRLIAATNRNLEKMAQGNMFRSDLLYRIRSFQINLPPLRERMDDLKNLADFHLDKICRKYRIVSKELSSELLEAFKVYAWPGNVRELVNTLERAVAAAGDEPALLPHHLPENIRIQVARAALNRKKVRPVSGRPIPEQEVITSWDSFRKEAVEMAERQYLINLLEKSGNDLKGALSLSGLSRSRLYEILKKHQIAFPGRRL